MSWIMIAFSIWIQAGPAQEPAIFRYFVGDKNGVATFEMTGGHFSPGKSLVIEFEGVANSGTKSGGMTFNTKYPSYGGGCSGGGCDQPFYIQYLERVERENAKKFGPSYKSPPRPKSLGDATKGQAHSFIENISTHWIDGRVFTISNSGKTLRIGEKSISLDSSGKKIRIDSSGKAKEL